MVRELSVHQEHELLNKLEGAGLGKDLAQAIINSRDNTLAREIVDFANEKIGLNDYKFIKKGIVIEEKERNRQEILSNIKEYELDDSFKNILAKCRNGKIEKEILREDELARRKNDKEIIKEMKVSEITPDQIAERIIQLGKINKWTTIVGCCNGLRVLVIPIVDSPVKVFACEPTAWSAGVHLLSRDIEV
ncbi:MAG: hypothetical protein US50_C0002G0003 [Candidatus Nomurabacteria bacterium GW2011_GWB1_37_5]|uniref:Uncharacterized protein n=1 Tax=Candidatus Nomurabacteria bacterium GW2011_GWB1_37_5 TaxID=1618742 RepID=A0A0G0GY73_9BACT|nr:MAG: hypothetical protein US50_C0002G0003 [Candidatus Nomurabacteria bacterium GW2011_GWB1_37_5]